MNLLHSKKPAILLLEDGSTFEGYSLGKEGIGLGEIVFNTAMTGYQEILTDPSYAGQIITFSTPHIGNVGVNHEDIESHKMWASGIVVQDCCDFPSHFKSQANLAYFLNEQHIVGISGINTRAVVTHLRNHGSQKACIVSGDIDLSAARNTLNLFAGLQGKDLTKQVSTPAVYQISPHHKHHVVVIDYGVKLNILRMLVDRNCHLTVVPSDFPIDSILEFDPDGIVLSNGPGDPTACLSSINTVKKLLHQDIPIFGICLGHQLLALASGAKTFKMKFGHHGANHPVLNLETQTVHISSQNHSYAVDPASLPDHIIPTFISLFDQTLQGLRFKDKPFFSIQGHPEASPGPTDLGSLFDEFIKNIQLRDTQCQKEPILIAS